MTQYARPDSTEAAGEWYDTEMSAQDNLHLQIDESSTDDNDFVQAMDSDGSNITCKLGLSNVSDPSNAANHKVVVRAQGADGGGGIPELKFALYLSNGSTKIAEHTFTPADSSWGNTTLTFSTSEANAITSYDNLQIWLILIPLSGGSESSQIMVSQTWFECDDAAAAVTTNPAFLLFID